mgnify:CR=1 FL=1
MAVLNITRLDFLPPPQEAFMAKTEPTIQKFMTYQPHYAEYNETVENAQTTMSKLEIRHLPVMKNGIITGIVSDRDIKMALSLVEANPKLLLVKDICHEDPYVVDPEVSLRDVVSHMAEKRYGCAIIAQNKKLVGIFTTVDACRALVELLETRFHTHSS